MGYIRSIVCAILLVFAAYHSGPAEAQTWAGITQGKIGRIEVTAGMNLGFRVFLENYPPLCGAGSQSWVFLQSNDDNYQAYLSVLNSAWLASRTVIIHGVKDSSGYCRLGYLVAF